MFTPDDLLVGCAGVRDSAPRRIRGWGDVPPEHKGLGIGTYLAQWVEARARRTIVKAPTRARVVLLQNRLSTDTLGHDLLRQ